MLGIFEPNGIQKGNNMLVNYFMNFIPQVVSDEFRIINTFSTNKLKRELDQTSCVFDIPINKIIEEERDWDKVRKRCGDLLDEGGFDSFIVYKTAISPSFFKAGAEREAVKTLESTYSDLRKGMNFKSAQGIIAWLVLIGECAKRAKHFYQYVVDPQEPDLGKIFSFDDFNKLYYNKADRIGTKLMPFYEYMLEQRCGALSHDDKDIPFVFYCTALTPDRRYIADMRDELESVPGWDVNVVASKGAKDKEHARRYASQDAYFAKLRKASVSLVIKAYDHEAFSWMRLCECVFNGCVPLVWSDCNLQDVETIFPEAMSIVRRELMVGSIDELKSKVSYFDNDQVARKDMVKELKEAIAKRHVLDIEWLRNRWQKLPAIRGV